MDHRGRLLVATPLIGDPNFSRTVVFLLAHSDDGAFGLVINRPSESLVREVLPDWSGPVAAPAVAFVGGPVTQDLLIALALVPGEDPPGFQRLIGDLGTIELADAPPALTAAVTHWRCFAGSAGWAAGQLEDELAEGAWWVADADPRDVFTSDPAGLWRAVLRRQPGELAWFANHPDDPTDN